MIIRGTTPDKEFGLPFGAELISGGFFTLMQNGKTVIEKNVSKSRFDGKTLIVSLTQEDTLLLSAKHMARMAVVIVTTEGERYESQPIWEIVGETSKNEVI